MSAIDDSDLEIKDGRVRQVGIADRQRGEVVAQTDTAIVVKWPGHTRHGTWGSTYTPTKTCVYLIEAVTHERGEAERLTVRFLIGFGRPRRRA